MSEIKRILLVEDNPNDAELTLEALAEHNLANEVVHVKDGAEAMDYLEYKGVYANRIKGNPALILLDMKLPKLDGLQVLRRIRENEELKLIRVIMLTSSREENDLVQSYKIGVQSYVVKPLEFTEFMNAVKQIGSYWAIINVAPPGTIG